MPSKGVKQSDRNKVTSQENALCSHILNGCEISFVLIRANVKELAVNENEWLRVQCFEFRCVGELQEAQGSASIWDIVQKEEAGVRGGLETKSYSEVTGT